MKVLLIAIHAAPSPQAIPLANACLASYLAADREIFPHAAVTLVDFMADQDPGECAARLLAEKPDAVGFSVYLWNRWLSGAIAVALRMERPGLTLFAGGPEPTADPAGLFREAPFDFLVIGEGEAPFREVVGQLAAGRQVTGGAGLAVRGEERVPGPGRHLESLDDIPSPYLTGLLRIGSTGGVLWQLSRGCDFACSFCYDPKGARGVRRFSFERLDAELDWFVRNGAAQVFVLDSTFNREMKRAKEVLRLISRRAPHIHFHFEVRSEFLDAEMARLFAGVNCSLQIGLQSSDPEIMKGVRRVFNPEDFEEKVALLNSAGAIFGFDLIYGLPGDTLSGFRRSLDFALGFAPNHLDIFPLAVLPGTELADRADSLGMCRLLAPPYTVAETPTFPACGMAAAARLAAACDIFYSRGKAVAWFGAVLSPLRLGPAEFLAGFGCWLEEREGRAVAEGELADGDIWQLQRTYLQYLFSGKRLRRLMPAALDLVDYHYYYGAALMAPQPDLPTDRELAQADLLEERFVLAPDARLARFNYEIFDILEAGDIDLEEFTDCFSAAGSCAVIYPRAGDVFTESLIEPYYLLLERLDGVAAAGAVASSLRVPDDEALSFLEFAAAEGIIQSALPR